MSTPRHLLTLAGSLLCAAALHAEAPAKTESEPAKAEPAPEPYQLKNRSSFACAGEGVRAPFWPIGWVHRKGVSSVVSAVAAPKSSLDEKNFRVTSILLGSGATPSLAVINGRAYGEGEYLKAPRAATTATGAAPVAAQTQLPAKIRVQQITDGSVVLQCAEQSVTVTFHRPSLAAKQPGRELSLEDR